MMTSCYNVSQLRPLGLCLYGSSLGYLSVSMLAKGATEGLIYVTWSSLKVGLKLSLAKVEHIFASRQTKRERGIWQRRYWENKIRGEIDLVRHVDYIYSNPVKHGWVTRFIDWPAFNIV